MEYPSVSLPRDDHGEDLHAHGGQIVRHQGMYFWIGEDRRGPNRVSCYASSDLLHWEFRNHLLTLDSPTKKHPTMVTDLRLTVDGKGCNIERPKVVYSPQSKRFVMWMHWELPDNYSEARCAVAVCDSIDGEYTYLGSFNPCGYMSRDCTLFVDGDGAVYFVSTARENLDLHIYRLTEDCLAIDRLVRKLFPGQQQEAPTLFKRGGRYFLLSSGCTGWAPNQSSWASATALDGTWTPRHPFGDQTTYRSQPTWVLSLYNADTGEDTYWYLGDRWGGGGERYFRSQYVLLPIEFSNGEPSIAWQDSVQLPDVN